MFYQLSSLVLQNITVDSINKLGHAVDVGLIKQEAVLEDVGHMEEQKLFNHYYQFIYLLLINIILYILTLYKGLGLGLVCQLCNHATI